VFHAGNYAALVDTRLAQAASRRIGRSTVSAERRNARRLTKEGE
jgi:hypothetical protein